MLPLPYIAAGALAVGLLTGWTANGWRLNAKIDAMVLEHTQALQVATEKAAKETARMQGEKDAALRKAAEQVQRNVAAAAAARDERDRLRDDLTTGRFAMSNATNASLVEYATTLSSLFEQCTREYLVMAEKADGHAADAQGLFSAWQAITQVK